MTAPALAVSGATARLGGQVVARMRWSGKVVTVISVPGGEPVGRLMPRGYDQGAPDDGSGLVDAWTARHPAAPTPSDVPLGRDLTLAEGVALLLSRADLYSFP